MAINFKLARIKHRWVFGCQHKTRFLAYLLNLIFISLTTSSCGVLWEIYQSQQDHSTPYRSLEINNEYEILWNTYDIKPIGFGRTSMIIGAPDKIIILGGRNNIVQGIRVFGIDSTSGDILWGVTGSHGNITASDYAVYIGTIGSVTVHSLDIENGNLLWYTHLPGAHSTSDIYFAEKRIFVHTSDSEFFILDDEGNILDNFQENFRTFLELNGNLYMGDVLGIQAIELFSKKELWKLRIGERYTHTPIFDGGEIFLRTWNIPTSIYSIDQYTGKVNWIASQDALSNLCLVGDNIYFTNPDGYLVAINRYSSFEVSRVKFLPTFDIEKQISTYTIACDRKNNVLAISFGDRTQIMGLKILNP